MAREAHPAKEKVCKWLVETHSKTPFSSVKDATEKAIGKFSKEELKDTTVANWVRTSIPAFTPVPREKDPNSPKKTRKSSTTFEAPEEMGFEQLNLFYKEEGLKALIRDARKIAKLQNEIQHLEEVLAKGIKGLSGLLQMKESEVSLLIDQGVEEAEQS